MVYWIDGTVGQVPGIDAYGYTAAMIRARVGYEGHPLARRPIVGETYRAHVVLAIGFPQRGSLVVGLGLRLPARTSLAGSAIRCVRTTASGTVFPDSAADPSVRCPQPPLTPRADDHLDLLSREVPQGDVLELVLDLVTTTEVDGELLQLRVETDWGLVDCSVPVRVHPAGPPPPASGRLAVRVEPPVLPLGRPVTFTVVTEDSGNGDPVPGVVQVRNFVTTGGASALVQLATNAPATLTFFEGPAQPPPLQLHRRQPAGRARAATGATEEVPVPFTFRTGLSWRDFVLA